MHLTTLLPALLSTLPRTLSLPTSPRNDVSECGYVLTARNSSTYASISAFPSCTPIYYNESLPGYQDAYAYSLYEGCGCTFHLSEKECVDGSGAPIYEGPTGAKPGKEPLFGEPQPKWYYCESA